ncbi:peptidylprolyl isomerase [Deinococcus radiotolerans]|uniref:Peptidylprolyl isomerase n=1 Tax=Deinococcus radiotolerans TaxID=1309407 RepID=A0ABQ2FDD6_9DEIO|nr:peptidylprolyl isomerase [Deinococcus radiotolerans]GGK87351.1 peptidylprolyl isomerase [Deinococcus radiotolerans]
MKQFLLTALLLSGAALAQTDTTAPATPAPATTTPAPTTTPAAAPTQDPAAVVARVGTQTYTMADYDRAFRLAVARVLNGQGLPYSDEYITEFAEARADFLKQFVRDRAVEQLARASVKLDAAVVDKQMEEARADFESDAAFLEALKATGYSSADELRAELERRAVVNAYLEKVQGRFTFGDALVGGFYNLHKAEFQQDPEACVKHILVPTQAEAQAIAKDLAGGADFAAVAKAKSQDPGSAAQGGDLGCFGPGEMVETFDAASFKGPVNQVQTVQSQFGWHLVLVTKRTDAGLLPLAEAAPLIRAKLSSEAAQKYLDAQVAKLTSESFPDRVTVAPASK